MLKQGTLAPEIRGDRRRTILVLFGRGAFEGGENEDSWFTREELAPKKGEVIQYDGDFSCPRHDTIGWLYGKRLIKARMREATEDQIEAAGPRRMYSRRKQGSLVKRATEYQLTRHGLGYAKLFSEGKSVVPKPCVVPAKKGLLLRDPINDFRFEGSLVELPEYTVNAHRATKRATIILSHVRKDERKRGLTVVRKKFVATSPEMVQAVEDLSLYCHVLVRARACERQEWEILGLDVRRRYKEFSPLDKSSPEQVAYLLHGGIVERKKTPRRKK